MKPPSGGSMPGFVGKAGLRMGPQKRQKSPFDLQQGVVKLHHEWRSSLFCFFSCPGHEETGRSRKGLRATKEHRQSPPKDGDL